MHFSQAFVLAAIPFLASAYVQDDTYTILARRAELANAELDHYVQLMSRSFEENDMDLYARDADLYDDEPFLYARDFDDEDYMFFPLQRRTDPPTANYAKGTHNYWQGQPDAGMQLGDLTRVTQEAINAGTLQHPAGTHIGGRQPPHDGGSQAAHVATVGERPVGSSQVTTHHLPAVGPVGNKHYAGGDIPFTNANKGKAALPAKGPPMGITHPPIQGPPAPGPPRRTGSDPAGRARSPSPGGRRSSTG